MSETAIWSVIIFIPSLVFFLCLGYFSLQYHSLLYETHKETVDQFISSLKFPASIFQNVKLRELLTAKTDSLSFILLLRIVWSLGIVWLFVRGLPFAIARSEYSDKLVYIVIFLLYVLAFYFSLRFGRILRHR